MRIYLDLCCLKRPFDDQRQARVQIETLALDAILQFCRDGSATLVSSRALEFENGRNFHERRRDFAARLLALAGDAVGHTPAVAGRATLRLYVTPLVSWVWIGMALALGSPDPATSGHKGQSDRSGASPGWRAATARVLALGRQQAADRAQPCRLKVHW